MEMIFMILLLFGLCTANDLELQGCSVTAEVGGTAILPVKVNLTEDSLLSNPYIKWWTETGEFVHQYRNNKDYNEQQVQRFKGRTSLFEEEICIGNVSLKISNVTKSDEGNYTCQVFLLEDPVRTYNVSLCVTENKVWVGVPNVIGGTVFIFFAALIVCCCSTPCKRKSRRSKQPTSPRMVSPRYQRSWENSTMSEEKPKEGVKTGNGRIILRVAGQDGRVVQFRIKRHTPLSQLIKPYCEKRGLSTHQIRFKFDGERINETDTPEQLEMEDEDTIDAFQEQTGGGCS